MDGDAGGWRRRRTTNKRTESVKYQRTWLWSGKEEAALANIKGDTVMDLLKQVTQCYDDAAKVLQGDAGCSAQFIGEPVANSFNALLAQAKQVHSQNNVVLNLKPVSGKNTRWREFLIVCGQLKTAVTP